jgi:hypothetical protein
MARLKSPNESFSFTIPSYGLDHQGGAIVDILVNLDFKKNVGASDPFAYPEFVSIVNFIKDYLVKYPNETDFWEILNRNLTQALLTEKIPTTFGVEYQLDKVVDSLTTDIQVSAGSSLVNFPRTSTVTGSPRKVKDQDFREGFSFAISDYGLDHQGGAIVDILVDLDFKKDIGVADPFAYPEFVSIVNFIKDYLVKYPNETDFWEILNRNLTQALLTEKIPTTFGVEYNLSEVVDSLTVDIGVESGSSLVNFNRASKVTGSPSSSGIDFNEGFSFEINDYGLDHQGGAVVDLKIDLDFKKDFAVADPYAYPEFVSIVNFVEDYLVSYPNETDFWEILNKNLVNELLTQTIPTVFGAKYNLDQILDDITVDIDVKSGSSLVNYDRSSQVKGSPSTEGIDLDESFSFEINDYGLDHQGGAIADILVDMKFKDGIGSDNPFEYPEFVSIVDFIKDYLVHYPNETDFWEILNKNLASTLLSDAIPTPFGFSYYLSEVVDTLDVEIKVNPGSSLVNFPRTSTVSQSIATRSPILGIEPSSMISSVQLENALLIKDFEIDRAVVGTQKSDSIIGSRQGEALAGGQGKDIIRGGSGPDAFVFENPGQFGEDNADIVTDFRRADGDKIVIARDLLSDTKKASFESVAGRNNANKAGRTNKFLIYDNKNGALYFNENGKESGFGDGGQLAKLLGAPAFGIEDIIIV